MKNTPEHTDFEALLEYLKRSRGFDFSGYKRASLGRRISKRMQLIKVNSYDEYIDYLETHPDEFTQLFNTILINVTSFFRDPESWEYLAQEIIPRILASKKENETLRAWSVGCATGEEAFSIAMVLAEALGRENFNERVKIYATDIDEDALTIARQATYFEKGVEGIPAEYREKYLEKNGDRFTVQKDLRRAVIFGRHDLIQDAPISRIDLLVCRNLLMYLNAETQAKVLTRLHFALSDTGFLFLGRAEMLLTHAHILTPVDLKMRIFARTPKGMVRERVVEVSLPGKEDAMNTLLAQVRLRDAAFEVTPIAEIVINSSGLLSQANEEARRLLGLNQRDVGRPFQDLQLSYRPIEMRSYIDRAYAKREPVYIQEVAWPGTNGEERFLDVEIHTISENGGPILGVVISFSDVTEHLHLQQELGRANQELETAMEELQSTNEELETTNEELQSTVEELETTNEELQSSNEELETMNEELRSGNEELETMNEELRRRTDELNLANAYLESILASLKGGVIVLDKNLDVYIWNRKAEDMWGLRPEEALQENFLNLEMGLPLESLIKPLRLISTGEMDSFETIQAATNRRGRPIQCKVTIAPQYGPGKQVQGMIVVTEEVDGKKE